MKLLVWLMLVYGLVDELAAAVEMAEEAGAGFETTGWVGGEGRGRDTDFGDVDDVERERVDVTGRVAECECDCECEGDGDC